MGGSSKKVTVGYRYFIGMHMVLCHGPVDRLQRIEVDERTAWAGFNTGGRININARNLFGGEDREGGVSGAVDFLPGGPGQGRNDYLQARLGTNIPAFRGAVSAVLRQVYVGLNPYLKPWAFRLQRVFQKSGGSPQWYPARAPIGDVDPVALYITIDVSLSMTWGDTDGVVATPSRLDITKEALVGVLGSFSGIGQDTPVDIMMVAWAGSKQSTILRRGVTGSDVQDLVNWVQNLGTAGGTNFEAAVEDAPAFFAGSGDKPRRVIFITDGEPNAGNTNAASATLLGIPGVQSFAFNILLSNTTETAKMDNTPEDGVPVIRSTDAGPLVQAIQNALFALINLNPAHIIHECLTDAEWGMGYLVSDLDDDAFRAAADTLSTEGMGISILWDRQIALEDFVLEILKHIDGVLRVNRRTGLFELKLIREDYDEEELLELGPWNVESVAEFNRPTFGELVNSVSVQYWDGRSGKDASITVQDLALTENQRATINTTVQYVGFTNAAIASRAGERDLRTLSTPLISCVLYCNQDARDLNVGDPFKLTWPDYGIDGLVMRVTQIAYGTGRSNKIKITASQDAFSTPDVIAFEPEPPDWSDPSEPPQAATRRLVSEMPYYELVQRAGQTTVDVELSANPELGYVMAAAGRPTAAHISARLATDGGGSVMEEAKVVDFAPTALLADDIGPMDSVIPFHTGFDVDLVNLGPWAQIDEELVAVDAVDLAQGLLTIRRGVLDTVPRAHSEGALIIFADEYVDDDETEYVLSDQVAVAFLPTTGQGSIPLAAAPIDVVEMNARAIRPYRPGNLRAFGELDPSLETYPTYPVEITWAHRNRRSETAPSFTNWEAGSLTPEPGTDYRLLIEGIGADLETVEGVLVDTVVSGTSYNLQASTFTGPLSGVPYARVTITARRDGWDSWQSPSLMFRGPLAAPTDLAAFYREPVAPENLTALLIP